MKTITLRLLALPVMLAVAGCSLTGGGNPTTGSIGGGGGGGTGGGGDTGGGDTGGGDTGGRDPGGTGGGGPVVTTGTAATAALVYAGYHAGVIGSGFATTDFAEDEKTSLVYSFNDPIPDLAGNPAATTVDGVEIPYSAEDSRNGPDRVVDVYKRSWNQFVSTPQNPRPPQAIDANGTEHVYVFRALDGIAPKDVTIARSVREVISGTQPDISRTYVGYHVTGEVTEDMPKNTTLNYEGRFVGHRNTQFTAAQNPQMGSAQYNGAVAMQASLTDDGGAVSGTFDGPNGFHAARTRIDFEGDVSGATFEARRLSITPNNSSNTDIVSIKDTSAVRGAFFGPGASEVGGVFLVEGEWRLTGDAPTAPYHFAGSFFGERAGD